MLGRAAMIAVPLAPTASIARHDDHRTAAKPVRWFNVAASRPRMDADRVPNCVLGRLEEKTIDFTVGAQCDDVGLDQNRSRVHQGTGRSVEGRSHPNDPVKLRNTMAEETPGADSIAVRP